MKKLLLAGSLVFALPLVAAAQQANLNYIGSLILGIRNLLDITIPLLIGLALVFFFYGLVQYIRKPGGGGEHGGGTDGKKIMIAGLVGLFLMVSVWGLVRLAQNVLGIDSNASNEIKVPKIPS